MAIEDTDDLALFFDTDDFAIEFKYTPPSYPHPSSKTRKINGQFSRGYVETAGVQGDYPHIVCALSEVADIAEGARVTANSIEYKIMDWQPSDSQSTVQLILQEQ